MLPVAGRFAWLATAGALVALAAGAGCQPVDSEMPPPDAAPAGAPPGAGATRDPGALPRDLDALLEQLAPLAAEWQVETVVAEVAVALDGERWSDATVTYLAPDSDRMLVVQVEEGGDTNQQRPTLATFDLEPVAAEGLAEVPALPGAALAPGPLAEAARETLEGCGTGEVDAVLYSTGAPAAWDGEAWTEAPAWTATLTGEGGAAVVDPVTGEAHAAGCLDPA